MFAAAASHNDSTLDTVILALKILAGHHDTPEPLQKHLLQTIQHALEIIDDPLPTLANATAEAISLAMLMGDEPSLKQAFAGLLETSTRDHLAKLALDGLEMAIEAHYQPAHFGREIYATI